MDEDIWLRFQEQTKDWEDGELLVGQETRIPCRLHPLLHTSGQMPFYNHHLLSLAGWWDFRSDKAYLFTDIDKPHGFICPLPVDYNGTLFLQPETGWVLANVLLSEEGDHRIFFLPAVEVTKFPFSMPDFGSIPATSSDDPDKVIGCVLDRGRWFAVWGQPGKAVWWEPVRTVGEARLLVKPGELMDSTEWLEGTERFGAKVRAVLGKQLSL